MMPWPYAEPPADGAPGVPNVPTDEGRALGAEIARLVDNDEARVRAAGLPVPPRCGDCATRLGTPPNGCAPTLMDFVKCAAEGEPFMCHVGAVDGEPARICGGWLLAVTP